MIWVLGRGGLLGGAVAREVGKSHDVWAPSKPIIWTDIDAFRSTMGAAIDEFSGGLTGCGGSWAIYWCAGVGTIGANDVEINGEFERAEYFLRELGSRLAGAVTDGTLFYSSSAGGIYGASTVAPVSEDSEVAVNSSYGSMKLSVENLFANWASAMSCRVAIGRISNLYGCGQNFQKQQGLVSAACLSLLKQRPLEIFVPLDTIRNYLYVEDAARVIVGYTEKVSGMPIATAELKIVCSPHNLSIAALLYEIRQVYGRRPPIGLGSRPISSLHNRNLSMNSVRHIEIEPQQYTLPAVGIAEIRRSLLVEMMSGSLAS